MPSSLDTSRAVARLALVLGLLFAPERMWAQHEADNWYFGERAGFRFTPDAEVC